MLEEKLKEVDEEAKGSDKDDVRWRFVNLCLRRLQSLRNALEAAKTDQEAMIGVRQQKEVRISGLSVKELLKNDDVSSR